jgi:preprotein translocase subunit SecF
VLLGEEVNLPVVAAVLTIIGYSLNDTIVNFDRIRENIELNPNVTTSELFALVNRSVNEMLSRTMLTAFTTLLAIGALLFFGGGILHTFSLSMFIGVTVGVYSSIYISNPMMVWTSMWLERRKAARTAEAKIRAEALRSAEERFSG